MNEDDAIRERLAAMTPADIEALYDATEADWLAIGFSRDAFAHNMRARADYDAVVRPLKLVYEAYVFMSDREVVREAKRRWEKAVADLDPSNPRNAKRVVADLTTTAQSARKTYDDAIEAAGDQRVIAAKRLYDAAVIRESERFAQRLP
jgi:hypothetical protein